eukprot:11203991-Lingulodinium_polyedra.AAC.1
MAERVLSDTVECTAGYVANICAGFQGGRQHVICALAMEPQCWRRTPRLLCGLDREDEQMVRQGLARALSQWVAM